MGRARLAVSKNFMLRGVRRGCWIRRRGWAGLGMARLGGARQGAVWHGAARRGAEWNGRGRMRVMGRIIDRQMEAVRHWIALCRWWWACPMYDPDARQAWKNETTLWIERMPKKRQQ